MPELTPKTSPKDFFLHLLTIVTLYASAVSLGTVLWQLINLTMPDPLLDAQSNLTYVKSLLRTGLSTLIIMFPAYLATSWYLAKDCFTQPEKRQLRIRRWLIYFTVFAATVIILISLVRLTNTLLDGELTLRFFLKLLSIFFIAGSIFGYYLHDLRIKTV